VAVFASPPDLLAAASQDILWHQRGVLMGMPILGNVRKELREAIVIAKSYISAVGAYALP
jgi:hypothetical protein